MCVREVKVCVRGGKGGRRRRYRELNVCVRGGEN